MNEVDKYILSHSTPRAEALDWVERETHLRTNFPRMLSGFAEGRLLEAISRMLKPRRILELGTFTGYSAICLASGLVPDGRLDALEINDEMEDLIREAFSKAGVSEKVRLIIGDAKETMKSLGETYDLVYIDANKREYPEYLDLVLNLPLVRPGSWIVADNVLWDGKVCGEAPSSDPQSKGIRAFNDAVLSDPRLENFILPLRDGMNIMRVL